MKIRNREVLITGGASGIGFALGNAFMRRNNKVLICGRNSEKLPRREEKATRPVVKSCDLTDRDGLENLVDWALQEQGEIDILMLILRWKEKQHESRSRFSIEAGNPPCGTG